MPLPRQPFSFSNNKRKLLNRRYLAILLLASIATAISSKLYLQTENIDPVRFHLRQLQAIQRTNLGQPPQTVADYFRLDTVRWYATGRSNNYSKRMEEEIDHEQALFQLGYLERRAFQLNEPLLTPGGGFSPSIRTLHQRLTDRPTDPDWWLFLSFSYPPASTTSATIFITCAKTKMPTVAELINQWNKSKNASPKP